MHWKQQLGQHRAELVRWADVGNRSEVEFMQVPRTLLLEGPANVPNATNNQHNIRGRQQATHEHLTSLALRNVTPRIQCFHPRNQPILPWEEAHELSACDLVLR